MLRKKLEKTVCTPKVVQVTAVMTSHGRKSERPSQMNNQRGEKSSRKRRSRKACRQGFKCGGRERASGWRVMGTSLMRSDLRVALMIISEANSMRVVFNSIFA